jgi:cobalamin-dependent methionine synthase I
MTSTFHILLSLQQETITRTTQKKKTPTKQQTLTLQNNANKLLWNDYQNPVPPPNGLQSKHPNLNNVDPFLNTSPSLTSLFESPLNYTSNHTSNCVNNSPKQNKKKVPNNFQCKCIKNKNNNPSSVKRTKKPIPSCKCVQHKKKIYVY